MQRRTAWTVCLTMGLLIALAPAEAGTADDPEVTDPTGDGGPGGRDVAAVHFALVDAGNATITMELGAEYSAPTTRLFAQHTRVATFFKPTTGLPEGTEECYVYAMRGYGTGGPDDLGSAAGFGCTATAGEFAPLGSETATTLTWDGTTIAVNLPLAFLEGFQGGTDALREPYAVVWEVSKGPTAGSNTLNQHLHSWDRAPDDGFGRDWSTVGLVNETAGAAFALDAPAGTIQVPALGRTVETFGVRNTGDVVLNLSFAVGALEDGFGVTLANETLAVSAGNSTQIEMTISTSRGAGNSTTFNITGQAADGTLRNATVNVTVGPSAAPAGGNQTADNGTVAGDGSGQAPGAGLAIVLAGTVAALAVTRRRRG